MQRVTASSVVHNIEYTLSAADPDFRRLIPILFVYILTYRSYMSSLCSCGEDPSVGLTEGQNDKILRLCNSKGTAQPEHRFYFRGWGRASESTQFWGPLSVSRMMRSFSP